MLRINLCTVPGLICVALALVSSGCGGGSSQDSAQVAIGIPGTSDNTSSGTDTPPSVNPVAPPNVNPVETAMLTISNTLPTSYRWADLTTGAAVYIDRTFTITSFPTLLQGLKYLQTANDDKWMSDPAAITFNVNEPVTVYVAFDRRNSQIPVWLQSWTDTGSLLQTTDTVLSVFEKGFLAGTVTLGGNEFGNSMYSVAVNAGVIDNGPLTIGGNPATSITEGMTYSFVPTSDGGQGSRTFSISNKPAWASFNNSSGALTGTPGIGDVGTTSSSIVISASSDQQTISLPAFAITVLAIAGGSATLTWSAPTKNADNTLLTDLDGYNLHYGTTLGNYPNSIKIANPGITTSIIENLAPGTWYFVISAFDRSGNESALSAAVSKTLQ